MVYLKEYLEKIKFELRKNAFNVSTGGYFNKCSGFF